MNDLKIFFRHLFRYRENIVLNIIFNVLYVFTSVFSITLIAPFVSVLFGMVPPVEQLPDFAWNMDTLLNAAYYYIGRFQALHGTMQALVILGVFFILVTLVSNIFRFVSIFFMARMRSFLLRDIRTDLYTHILELPISFFSEQRKGDLLSRMNNDVGEVERAVVSSLQGAIMEPLFVILFVTGLFVISWQLSLTILVAFPPVMYVSSKIGAVLKKKSTKAQEILGRMVSRAEENIAGLRIIKSFNLIELAERNFRDENVKYMREANAIQRRRNLAGPLTEMMLITVTLAVMLFGGMRVVRGGVNADMFILFLLLLIKVISPAKHTVTAYYDIQKGRAALMRIYSVLERPVEEESPKARPVKGLEREIVYENVSFHYEDFEQEVLEKVNLRLEKGRTYAFVGASGAGKTTAADLLSRFYAPVSGRIIWDGIDTAHLRRADLREQVGTVSQFPFVWHDTVEENIRFGRSNVSREQVVEAAKKAFAHEFIMQLPQGYDTVLGDNGSNLSGGQRQRIVIARAILKNAPVLVLDEATSALDTESELMVQKALTELMKGRTSVVIAHRLSTIQNADEIVVFEKGRIIERGTHTGLMALGGVYAKLVSLQSL